MRRPEPSSFAAQGARQPPQRVLVRLSGSDLHNLCSRIRGSALIVCRTDAEVVQSIAQPGVRALIWEMSPKSLWDLRVPATVLAACRDILWIIRADPTPGAMRELAVLAKTGLDWRASLRGFDDLVADAEEALLGGLCQDCDSTLVRAADNVTSRAALSLVFPALIAGRRRVAAARICPRGWPREFHQW
jgi:hypothetical protein